MKFLIGLSFVLVILAKVNLLSSSTPDDSSTRSKRQSTTLDCTTLPFLINDTQTKISALITKLSSDTAYLNKLFINFENYKTNFKDASGLALIFATRVINSFQNAINFTSTSIETCQQNLLILRSDEASMKADFQTFCMLPPALSLCGTFVPYDSINDANAPSVNGFVGGTNQDGSSAFVGFSNAGTCQNKFSAPCSLTVSGTSPGCKIPCGTTEVYDGTSSFYLIRNTNLEWVSATSASVPSILYPLRIPGPDNFMFGRALVNGRNVLGAIQGLNGDFSFRAVTENGAVQLYSGFEVLTCRVNGCSCSKSSSISSGAPNFSFNIPTTPQVVPMTTKVTTTTEAPIITTPQTTVTESTTTVTTTQEISTQTPSTTTQTTISPWCSVPFCKSGEHVLCVSSGQFSPSCGTNPTLVSFDSATIQVILDAHNQWRNDAAGGLIKGYQDESLSSATRMAKVQWSSQLAQFAELNVKKCVMAHDKCVSSSDFNYAGQNLAWRGSTLAINVTATAIASINSWGAENDNTRTSDLLSYLGSGPNGTVIGHFTQLVSEKVTHVGCAMSTFYTTFNQAVFACNYAFGNLLRGKVYKFGAAASECITGSDPTFPNLCSINENFSVNNPFA